MDLLNDSIAELPEQARQQLDDFLAGESGSRRRSTSSWKRRLLHGPSVRADLYDANAMGLPSV